MKKIMLGSISIFFLQFSLIAQEKQQEFDLDSEERLVHLELDNIVNQCTEALIGDDPKFLEGIKEPMVKFYKQQADIQEEAHEQLRLLEEKAKDPNVSAQDKNVESAQDFVKNKVNPLSQELREAMAKVKEEVFNTLEFREKLVACVNEVIEQNILESEKEDNNE